MKDLFIFWIVIQLFVIGVTSASIENKVANKTYDCRLPSKQNSVLWGIAFPLVAFVPNNGLTDLYCKQ